MLRLIFQELIEIDDPILKKTLEILPLRILKNVQAVLPTGIQDGDSVKIAAIEFENDNHSVGFKIDVENHTNKILGLVENYKKSGKWQEIPEFILPGKKESAFGHNLIRTATGRSKAKSIYLSFFCITDARAYAGTPKISTI